MHSRAISARTRPLFQGAVRQWPGAISRHGRRTRGSRGLDTHSAADRNFTICDWMCQSKLAVDTTGELLARHNVADGVYAEQVGLLIIPAELRMGPAAPDPFMLTNPDTLLDALSTFRRNNSTVAAFGLAHLMRGGISMAPPSGSPTLVGSAISTMEFP